VKSSCRAGAVHRWAWRKGHRYGTILCDLEHRRVIDLLPDRSADTLAAWLAAHPSVTIVVRDRAGAYAEGVARGAPDALQIADRWHLLRNARDALLGILEHHHRDLRAAARTAGAPSEPPAELIEAPPPVAPEPERQLRSPERRAWAAHERRDTDYAEAIRLREQILSARAVARSLGVGRKTVRRWLRAGHAPTWRHADRGTGILDPYHSYLEERWQAGCRNAVTEGHCPDAGAGNPVRAADATAAVRLLTGDPDTLSDDGRHCVHALQERSSTIAMAADLVARFSRMMKDKCAEPFDGWLREADASAGTVCHRDPSRQGRGARGIERAVEQRSS